MIELKVVGGTKKQKKSTAITRTSDVYKAMQFLEKKDREQFYVLHLTAKKHIVSKELVSMGTLTNSLIHPREVFKGAISNSAASIICVHNHPSGDVTPSKEDIAMTQKLIKAGEIIGIPVLDHVIIGKDNAHSTRESNPEIFKSPCDDVQTSITDNKGEEPQLLDRLHEVFSMTKKNLKVVESKRDSLAEARKVSKDLRARSDNFVYEFLEREDEPIDEKMHVLVKEALTKLTPIKAMLEDENLERLDDFYKLTATVDTVKEVHNLLIAASDMYFTVH